MLKERTSRIFGFKIMRVIQNFRGSIHKFCDRVSERRHFFEGQEENKEWFK